MIQIGLRDVNFAHVFSSSGWNIPQYFNWCRTTINNKICFFTDYCLDSVENVQAEKKIAWLLEPPAINQDCYNYIRNYNNQFDYVLTYDRSLVDNNKILFYPLGGCWIPDIGDQRNRPHMVNIHPKKYLISIIASNKNSTVGHQLRHMIVNRCSGLTAFGPRYKTLEFKEDALVDYMFSIVVENSIFDDYFTEKLIDCFAVGTIPIYWGTKNIHKYFNINGMLTFNNLSELDDIIKTLSPELYNNKLQYVTDNFDRHFRYRTPENWIFEQYPQLFS